MQKNMLISILAVSMVFGHCKKNTGLLPPPIEPDPPPFITPTGMPEGSPVSKTIGSAGGSIVSPDGRLTVNFPSGALTTDTEITIQPVINFCPGGMGLAYHLMPDKITFGKPVSLTYHYTDEELSGTHPYFFYIAYQDSLQGWKADYKNRNIDTIAKTVSLGVGHFSIWSMGDNLMLISTPSGQELYERETRELRIVMISQSVASGPPPSSPGEDDLPYLPQETILPDNIITNWKVNGDTLGNALDGTISETGNRATYTAPAPIEERRAVQVSAEVDYPMVFFNNGRQVASVDRFILFKDLVLLPSEFEYSVDIHFTDSAVAGYKPGQIYSDKASFDLSIKKTKDNRGIPIIIAAVSNLQNHLPTVSPLSQTYRDPLGTSSLTWDWIPDSVGQTNIVDVNVTSFDDSTVDLEFVHRGTLGPGHNWRTSLGNSGTVPPTPLGENFGLPSGMKLKLIHEDQSFQWINVKATQ